MSVLSKEAANTQEKKVGSIIRLPRLPSNYNEEVKYLMLSVGAVNTKHSS